MKNLWNLRSQHPFDWVGHLVICFLIALWRPDYAIVAALTIEGTQIESGLWQGWDHLIDLFFDCIGIILAFIMRSL